MPKFPTRFTGRIGDKVTIINADGVELAMDVSGGLSVAGTVTVDASGATVPISVAGTVAVDASGATVPISHTGDMDVNINNTAGAITVDGSGYTVPVSHAGNMNVNVNALAGGITMPVSHAGNMDVNIAGTGTTVPISVAGAIDVSAATVTVDASGTTVPISVAGSVTVDASGSTVPISHAGDLNVDVQNASLSVVQTAADWDVENLNIIHNNDLIMGFAIDTFTLNHVQTGSVINFMENNTTSYLQLFDSDAGDITTTLILDFGSEKTFHSIIMNANVYLDGGGSWVYLDLDYSSNKADWFSILDYDNGGAGAGGTDMDGYGEDITCRYLKVTFRSRVGGGDKRLRIYKIIASI